ncbi:ROK family transcriptional regulator [Allorhizobium sp. BGMRC 0089]|uniref:ROK family transcriptional regulator n=1 Tax=Allorhizobium sonneratiae TaxID=2934936 RepID=UPI002033FA01|nr:ROK family transcriptional regulator [Allorhizobium sonneratiae]MCM2293283.1 ROK family transcriptional regulator [Allorhizobium sonneratiae]
MTQRSQQPPVLRQISVRAVMDVLLQEGPTSRASLAKKTGLSKQTMSEVIRNLEAAGWVRVKGVISGKVGRSAVTYEVAETGGYALGIDLGATTVRIAIVSMSGTIVYESEHPSDKRTGEALIELMQTMVEDGLKQQEIPREKILLAAIGLPGVVDPVTGHLSLAPNMGEIGSLNITHRLSETLGCDVVIENDINAAALGESWKGCSAGLTNSTFLSLGTGIGLGMLIDGKLIKGATGAAGEIAYLPFGFDPYARESLERGAIETALGAKAILARYTAEGGRADNLRDLLAEAEIGQEPALSVITAAARLAALLVVSVDAMINPEKIVLGGNTGRHPLIFNLIEKELPRLSRRRIDLETSRLGTRATLIGAVAIALNQAHNALFSPQDLPGEMRLPK